MKLAGTVPNSLFIILRTIGIDVTDVTPQGNDIALYVMNHGEPSTLYATMAGDGFYIIDELEGDFFNMFEVDGVVLETSIADVFRKGTL